MKLVKLLHVITVLCVDSALTAPRTKQPSALFAGADDEDQLDSGGFVPNASKSPSMGYDSSVSRDFLIYDTGKQKSGHVSKASKSSPIGYDNPMTRRHLMEDGGEKSSDYSSKASKSKSFSVGYGSYALNKSSPPSFSRLSETDMLSPTGSHFFKPTQSSFNSSNPNSPKGKPSTSTTTIMTTEGSSVPTAIATGKSTSEPSAFGESGSNASTTTTGVTVSTKTTTTAKSGITELPAFSATNQFLGCIAKRVKVQSTTPNPIQMFELQVLESGTNVALQGSVRQSSAFNGNSARFGPENAIDNDVSTFSHTKNEFGSWWEVDLRELVGIQSIRILNRYCGSDTSDPHNCLCRISNAEIYLYDDHNDTVATRVLGDTCGEHIVLEEFISCTSTQAVPSKTPSSPPTNKQTICKEPYDGYCKKGIWDCIDCK